MNRTIINRLLLSLLVIFVSSAGRPASAQPLRLRLSMAGGYLSNAYLDGSEEPTGILSPEGSVTVYFARAWQAGYEGRMDWYSDLGDLDSHGHDAHIQFGPHWKTEEGLLREYWIRLGMQSLFNSPEIEELDHLTPRLVVGSTYDLSRYVSLAPLVEANYRNFLNDPGESQVNAFACTQLGLHLPSRTTFLIRPCYGFRWYFEEAGFLADSGVDTYTGGSNQDSHQVDLRVRLAQNLSPRLGLRLEYLGRIVPRASDRADTDEERGTLRADLTGDFRYYRHRPGTRLTWLVTDSLMTTFDAAYEWRKYEGIDALVYGPASTILRAPTDRVDDRLVLGAAVEYRWRPVDSVRFTLGCDYSFLKIWSTADIYDSVSHEVMATVSADWMP